MKIGVIADTHIPDRSKVIPDKILKDFKDTDMIIHAGDLVDLDVLRQLKSICPNVKAVYGNMDPYEVRKELPEKEIIKAGNHKIGVMHGSGSPVKLIELMTQAFKDDGVDIVIFGHSHTGFNEKIGNILFFNPGSATDKINAAYNSYGIIEINGGVQSRIVKI